MAMRKIKAGVFDGLQMRILMRDPDFINSIDDTENPFKCLKMDHFRKSYNAFNP